MVGESVRSLSSHLGQMSQAQVTYSPRDRTRAAGQYVKLKLFVGGFGEAKHSSHTHSHLNGRVALVVVVAHTLPVPASPPRGRRHPSPARLVGQVGLGSTKFSNLLLSPHQEPPGGRHQATSAPPPNRNSQSVTCVRS